MEKRRIISTILLALFIFVALQLPWPYNSPNTPPVINNIFDSSKNEKIVFVSDTQDPIWVETFILNENENHFARQRIFEEVIKLHPKKIFHLGDIVALGYYEDDWKQVDKFLGKVIQEKIEFYPTLGNHELMIFSEIGEENFNERFPFYSRTGYSINNGATEIVLLNSNFSEMTATEITKQQKWYLDKLNQLEDDSTISAIVVGCHHSPFTNSKIVNPNEEVEKFFVTPFLEFNKCKLFLSGHCHAFEHFKVGDKDFLVIGGGGGLQQPLYVDEEQKWDDHFSKSESTRMFHFLEYELADDTMRISLNILNRDFSKFNDDYKIFIPL